MRDPAADHREDRWADEALLKAEAKGRRLALGVLGLWWLLAALVIVSVVIAHTTAVGVAIFVLAVVAPPMLLAVSKTKAVESRTMLKRSIGTLAIMLFFASLRLAFLVLFAVRYS